MKQIFPPLKRALLPLALSGCVNLPLASHTWVIRPDEGCSPPSGPGRMRFMPECPETSPSPEAVPSPEATTRAEPTLSPVSTATPSPSPSPPVLAPTAPPLEDT